MVIELGDKVKDIYTGFVGVAVAKIEFINGCVQFTVAPKVDKDNKQSEPIDIDEESLTVVKSQVRKKPKETGGAYNQRAKLYS